MFVHFFGGAVVNATVARQYPFEAIASSFSIERVCSFQEYQQTSRKAVKVSRAGDHARWSPVNSTLSR